ncbi:MAG: hypothetical protein WC710_07335 [Gallionella sp.]|jgi:hypothetical protein
MDTSDLKIFAEFERKINSSWWRPLSERQSLISTGWLEMQEARFQNAESKLGYLLAVAGETLWRAECGKFSVRGGAISIHETDEDGLQLFELEQAETESKSAKLEAQLSDDKQELVDVLRREKLAGIAKKNGCSDRSVQLWFKRLLQEVETNRKGEAGTQGDLFGGEK